MASNESALRRSIAQRLRVARARTDALFDLLTPEALFERPIAERHRLIFYVGHLEAFDWNLICRDVLKQRSSRPAFEQLFALGIDPKPGESPTDTPSDWPTREIVAEWKHELRTAVDMAVTTAPLTGWLQDGWAFQVAIEHRFMHAETLCYLLQRLELRFKVAGALPSVTADEPTSQMVAVPAGRASMGLSRRLHPHLGWDNEYEHTEVDVPAFSIGSLPVSNAQWLGFIEAGGYRERSLWSDDAWAWLRDENITRPASWRFRDQRWWWQAMFGEVPLPRGWPVYVSHTEATAYARWRGAALPSEAQWHRAVDGLKPETWLPETHGNFGGGNRYDPVVSGSFSLGNTHSGISDLIGNGWEWTSTVFAPFDGFEPMPMYQTYSANFFDHRHFVLKGASAVTDAVFLRFDACGIALSIGIDGAGCNRRAWRDGRRHVDRRVCDARSQAKICVVSGPHKSRSS